MKLIWTAFLILASGVTLHANTYNGYLNDIRCVSDEPPAEEKKWSTFYRMHKMMGPHSVDIEINTAVLVCADRFFTAMDYSIDAEDGELNDPEFIKKVEQRLNDLWFMLEPRFVSISQMHANPKSISFLFKALRGESISLQKWALAKLTTMLKTQDICLIIDQLHDPRLETSELPNYRAVARARLFYLLNWFEPSGFGFDSQVRSLIAEVVALAEKNTPDWKLHPTTKANINQLHEVLDVWSSAAPTVQPVSCQNYKWKYRNQ